MADGNDHRARHDRQRTRSLMREGMRAMPTLEPPTRRSFDDVEFEPRRKQRTLVVNAADEARIRRVLGWVSERHGNVSFAALTRAFFRMMSCLEDEWERMPVLSVDQRRADPTNPRERTLDEEALADLLSSVHQRHIQRAHQQRARRAAVEQGPPTDGLERPLKRRPRRHGAFERTEPGGTPLEGDKTQGAADSLDFGEATDES